MWRHRTLPVHHLSPFLAPLMILVLATGCPDEGVTDDDAYQTPGSSPSPTQGPATPDPTPGGTSTQSPTTQTPCTPPTEVSGGTATPGTTTSPPGTASTPTPGSASTPTSGTPTPASSPTPAASTGTPGTASTPEADVTPAASETPGTAATPATSATPAASATPQAGATPEAGTAPPEATPGAVTPTASETRPPDGGPTPATPTPATPTPATPTPADGDDTWSPCGPTPTPATPDPTPGSPTPYDTPTPADADGDGYDATAAGGTDCDDNDPRIHPDACEVPSDEVDQDCDQADTDVVGLECAFSRIQGAAAGDRLGSPVVSVADLDGDGVLEVMVGAMQAEVAGVGDLAGVARLMEGPPMEGPAATSEAAALFLGETADSFAGKGMAAGDLDGDGCIDLAISAPGYRQDRGAVYLFYGQVSEGHCQKWSGTYALSQADVRFVGSAAGDELGFGVAVAGTTGLEDAPSDLDGDGCADLLFGAPNTAREEAGYVGTGYLFYGRPGRFTCDDGQTPCEVSADAADARFEGWQHSENFGTGVEVRDFDGDGRLETLILAAPGHSTTSPGDGAVYFFQHPAGGRFSGALASTDAALALIGTLDSGSFGLKIGGRHDLTGDGVVDLVIPAPYAGTDVNREGRVYAYSGAALHELLVGETPVQHDDEDLALAVWAGSYDWELLGFGVDTTDDMTGDGQPDLAMSIGAIDADEQLQEGRAFVVSGDPGDWMAEMLMVVDRETAFASWLAEGPDEEAGLSIAGVPGWPGFVIGAPGWNTTGCSSCGVAYYLTTTASP